MTDLVWPKDRWGHDIQNSKIMQKAGYSEVEILKAELYALGEVIDSLPVGLCDMECHIYCDPDRGCEEWPEV